ncbi:cupin domain-containing protein [Pseudomonadota bacterium]
MVNSDTGNLFESIPENISDEIFSALVQEENVRIERIISTGQSSPSSGWYDQNDNEWVMVVKGEAKISFENGRVVLLKAGSYINLPAHTKHKVAWTKPDTETIWLAVHYR